MIVKDVMSSHVVSVGRNESVRNIAGMMSRYDIGAVPVVENDTVCGIVTDRDIVVRCVASGCDASVSTAEEVMTGSAACAHPNQSLAETMQLMSAYQVKRLPVTEGGRLKGMVSLSDIARIRTSAEVSKTLTEISRP